MRSRCFALLAAAVLLLLLTGCSRPENPLDWEVSGKRPATLQRWVNKNLPLMPPEISTEFQQACLNIATLLPKRDDASENERSIRLCAEISGTKVREVIAKGLRIEMRNLEARMDNQSRLLLKLVAIDPGPDERQQKFHAARVAEYRNSFERMKADAARYEARLAELTAPSP